MDVVAQGHALDEATVASDVERDVLRVLECARPATLAGVLDPQATQSASRRYEALGQLGVHDAHRGLAADRRAVELGRRARQESARSQIGHALVHASELERDVETLRADARPVVARRTREFL